MTTVNSACEDILQFQIRAGAYERARAHPEGNSQIARGGIEPMTSRMRSARQTVRPNEACRRGVLQLAHATRCRAHGKQKLEELQPLGGHACARDCP